jgi:putative ABC transport system ATP-binding protein
MADVVIQVKDLAFGYRVGGFRLSVRALRIGPGENVAMTGPSGSGKTTLLNLLAGILVPSGGQINVLDIEVSSLSTEDRQDFRALRMGLVFQEFELLEYLDVLDNVLLPCRVSPVLHFDGEVRVRAAELLDDVGLGDKLHRYPGYLSQGERQRVAVCRALVTKPAIIFGDEPTGNLDSSNRDHVMKTLFRYSADTKAPLIVVTHDHELIGRFDRTIDVRELAA